MHTSITFTWLTLGLTSCIKLLQLNPKDQFLYGCDLVIFGLFNLKKNLSVDEIKNAITEISWSTNDLELLKNACSGNV